MKLISLNIWAGKLFEPLKKYLNKNSSNTDIFCFQEVMNTSTSLKERNGYRTKLYDELCELFPNHNGIFALTQEGYDLEGKVDFPISFGNALFVKKNIEITSHGEIFIYGYRNSRGKENTTMPRNLQYVLLDDYVIAHLHGLWNGKSKEDNEDRIEQSRIILNFLEGKEGKKVLTGDFNLLPNTKSLTMLEEKLLNLIKKYEITSTRSVIHNKPDKYADYTLVSSDVVVESFSVPDVTVSDHLPMEIVFK